MAVRPADTAPPARHVRRADPTQVLWRRLAAYVIDGFTGGLIALVVLLAFADFDTLDTADCPDDLPGGRVCLDAPTDDDTVTLADSGALVAAAGLAFGWILLNDVLIQGVSGATTGKFITGVRTVRPDGRRPGLGRALVRTLMLVIDGINLILPIGAWVALFSHGHRRLGDMAADTYVVKAPYAGTPVELPQRP